jgi:GNAT superfamily N-acetyltransferase
MASKAYYFLLVTLPFSSWPCLPIIGSQTHIALIIQMTKALIREASPADTPQILHFINELAVYEKLAHEVQTNADMIQDTLFGSDAKAYCLIAEIGGQAVGFAIYFFNYSTWLGKYGIYLEDLYVSVEHRGKGAGKALLVHIAKIAADNNCGRFEWSVLDWNTPSIEFYKSLGAREMSDWRIYRVDGDALQALAEKQ